MNNEITKEEYPELSKDQISSLNKELETLVAHASNVSNSHKRVKRYVSRFKEDFPFASESISNIIWDAYYESEPDRVTHYLNLATKAAKDSSPNSKLQVTTLLEKATDHNYSALPKSDVNDVWNLYKTHHPSKNKSLAASVIFGLLGLSGGLLLYNSCNSKDAPLESPDLNKFPKKEVVKEISGPKPIPEDIGIFYANSYGMTGLYALINDVDPVEFSKQPDTYKVGGPLDMFARKYGVDIFDEYNEPNTYDFDGINSFVSKEKVIEIIKQYNNSLKK